MKYTFLMITISLSSSISELIYTWIAHWLDQRFWRFCQMRFTDFFHSWCCDTTCSKSKIHLGCGLQFGSFKYRPVYPYWLAVVVSDLPKCSFKFLRVVFLIVTWIIFCWWVNEHIVCKRASYVLCLLLYYVTSLNLLHY